MNNKEEIQKALDDLLGTVPVAIPITKDDQILMDFHGNAPTIDQEKQGINPVVSELANKYISDVVNKNTAIGLRIEIIGGGCSGFRYDFSLLFSDIIQDTDIVICNSPLVIIDNESIKYLYGAIVDIEESLASTSIVIKNPAAKQSCGCGSSFSV